MSDRRRGAATTGPDRSMPWSWIAIGSLLAAGFIVYAPALSYPFVNWDDPAYVTQNPYITQLTPAAVARLFAPSTIVVANWAPVTLLSYAIDHARGALDPRPYHLTNLLLHLVSGVLVLLLLRRWLGSLAAAWVGALVFLLHPVQIESVAWIAERKNVLSLALALGAMLLEPGPRHRPWRGRRVAALVCFAGALLAKATVVVVPLLMLAGWTLVDRHDWRRSLRAAAPYLMLGLVVGVITILAQRSAGGIKPYYGDSALLTLATMSRVVWLELALFVDPGRLSAVYRPPVATSIAEPTVLVAILALVAAVALAISLRRRRPLITAALAWYGIALLPVLNILPLPHLMADRFLYVGSIGIAMLAALGADAIGALLGGRGTSVPARRALVIIGVGLLVGVGTAVATSMRLPVWSSSERLWLDTLERTPTAEVAHSNLGLVLAARGESARAMEHYRQAVELRPDYTEARINLANALTRAGRTREAVAEYRQALALDPESAEAYYNLGVTLAGAGETEAARDAYLAAVELAPGHGRALNNLALLEAAAGRLEPALELLDTAVAREPVNAEAHLNRGIVLGRLQRYDEAIGALHRAATLRPDYARAHLQLGLALFARGERVAGRASVLRALEIDPTLRERIPPPMRGELGL